MCHPQAVNSKKLHWNEDLVAHKQKNQVAKHRVEQLETDAIRVQGRD